MTAKGPSRIVGTILASLLIAVAGAGGMYVYMRGERVTTVESTPPTTSPASESAREIAITLSPETAARAGIKSARPTVGQATATVAVPGIVEPNAYRQVVVRSVAAGQVRSVVVDLGTPVRRGDLLATIHSPDLAETVRMYLSMQSEFEAAHQRLTRLESLVKIGAASQQELEAARAEHTRHSTDVESARAKLVLLGVTPSELNALTESSQIESLVRITSPADGVITSRAINQGANIDASTDLFTVVDLDAVWIVANVFEGDLGRLRVGADARVSTPSQAQTWTGRVTYIDPQLASETRTAKVRVEIGNPGRTLKFGMYADVSLSASSTAAVLMVPRSALQTISNQTVVYVVDPQQNGRYLERSVAVGTTAGERIEILAGVTGQEEVVVAGSFTLRAERDRLGLPAPAPRPPAQQEAPPPATKVEIAVTKEGFVPNTATANAGVPVDLVFTRKTDDTCAKEVVVSSLNVRRPLPLNEPVVIRVPAPAAGQIAFVCGMNMLRGTVVVR